MKMSKLFLLLAITSLLIAEDSWNTRFNYFGNMSASKLNTAGYDLNNFGHNSVNDKWSLEPYSKIGAQISMSKEDLTFTAQALVRKAHEGLDSELTWFNVKYDLSENYAIRFGRIQTKVLLHSEYLDVDNLHLWAKPPVEVYRLMPIRTYDGLELTYRENFNDYYFNVSIVGFARYSDTIYGHRDTETPVDVYDSRSLTLTLENDMFTYKASYSRTGMDIKDNATILAVANGLRAYGNDMQDITYEDRKGKVYSLGFQYRNNNFTLDTEVVRLDSNGLLPSSTAGYMLVGYQMNKFTPYIMYAENKNDKDYYDVSNVNAVDATSAFLKRGLEDLLYINNYSQSTASIGARYDIKPGMAFNMQLDRITSTNYGSISSATVQSTGYEKVGILSRDAGTADKAIYALTFNFSFAY